jgi:CHAD domain-containing protein
MKPEPIHLRSLSRVEQVVERVLQTRLREVRSLTVGLDRRDNAGLHGFRIACKRLRYAIERFTSLDPSLQEAGEKLALLQDALGEAHDRDVLLTILPPTMPATERRLKSERNAWVDRACVLWRNVEQRMRALDSHRN